MAPTDQGEQCETFLAHDTGAFGDAQIPADDRCADERSTLAPRESMERGSPVPGWKTRFTVLLLTALVATLFIGAAVFQRPVQLRTHQDAVPMVKMEQKDCQSSGTSDSGGLQGLFKAVSSWFGGGKEDDPCEPLAEVAREDSGSETTPEADAKVSVETDGASDGEGPSPSTSDKATTASTTSEKSTTTPRTTSGATSKKAVPPPTTSKVATTAEVTAAELPTTVQAATTEVAEATVASTTGKEGTTPEQPHTTPDLEDELASLTKSSTKDEDDDDVEEDEEDNSTEVVKVKKTNLPCSGGGENCLESGCCKEAGMQCYLKTKGWATCKATCVKGAPDPTDMDASPWDCKQIGPRTAGKAVKVYVPPAKWVNKTCAGSGEDCSKSHCCKEVGLTCYEKMPGWAACKAECVAGAPDPSDMDDTRWSCKTLSLRTPGEAEQVYVEPAAWVEEKCSKPGENCQDTRCCAYPGQQCFYKNEQFATCKDVCVPGPDLMDDNADIWNCTPVGFKTPGLAQTWSREVADWVPEKCASQEEDCRKKMCCSDAGFQCFEITNKSAKCMEECEPADEGDSTGAPKCKKIGPMWTTTSTTTTTTRTYGSPSLFCFSVSRGWGYEPDILSYQLKKSSGIFACDEYAVLSSDPLELDVGWTVVKAIHFEPAPVGESKDHTAGNALLFMHVWDAINIDGRFKLTDWTIKMDPDAVLLPDRLRLHVKVRNGENVFVRNCNAFPSSGDFPMMYGSMEVLSQQALTTYFDNKERCDGSLPWPDWGEDYYLGKCLVMLGVQPFDDFGIVSDGVCTQVNCNDGQAAAFHPFKSVDEWKNCFNIAIGAR